MRRSSQRFGFALTALAGLMAALLACSLPDFFENSHPAPTKVAPASAVATVAAASATPPGTAVDTEPPPTPRPSPVPPTATQAVSSPGPNSAEPAKDPCGLPGIQVRANFFSGTGANALLAPFSGDVQVLKTPGGPNLFSMQQASVQRKFVIILPSLNPAVYDLHAVYMSYTEKTSSSDHNPRVWKAESSFLQVLACDGGGLALRTVADSKGAVGESVLFQPLSANGNTATGDMLIGLGARIQ